MFTRECPTCGRELDVSLKECPDCAAPKGVAESASPSAPPATPVASSPAAPEAPQATAATEPVQAAKPKPPRSALSLTPKHLLFFVFFLGVAVAAAVFLARPELLPKPELPVAWREPGPAEQPGRGNNDPLEIAGIRLVETESGEPVVRVLVVNHGEQAVRRAAMEVMLREFGAPVDAPPEVSFTMELDEPLESKASREMEIALGAAPESALPRWGRLRVDVRRLAVPSQAP